ncbi:MAG: hypothetical protein K2N27_05715 [Ruminococcus sp.]|nr:hypothetical protein [Ruminococcus sp.]
MNKNTKFSGGLHKSTKITLLSCVSFIILTMIILVFFILFPITPSERIIASIGRENIFNGNNNGNNVTAIPEVTTTTSDISTTAGVNTNPTKSTGTTTTKTFKIVITSGSGFMWNGRIPTGVMNNTKTTPVYADPVYPTRDPGYVYVPPVTQATTYPNGNETYPTNTDYPTSTDTGTDTPSATDTPTYTEPVQTEPIYTEPVYTEPVYTEPPIIIDPPSTTHEVIIPVESYTPPQEECNEW